jgi:aldose 1-epimerase
MIRGDHFLPVNEEMIPSGEIRPVQETPLDFLKPRAIGQRIREPYEQLVRAGGYDHTWVLNHAPGSTSRPAASAYDPVSGRLLEVFTTQPGLQFYTGNRLMPDKKTGRSRHSGFCFEAQKFPDTPHQAAFPSVVLSPGEIYSYTTIYKFCVQ